MNAAETWVDIYGSNSAKNTPSHFDDELPAAHFMTESGIVEAFILLGETPLNTFQQYTNLTGVAPLPQHAAFGFHQSRWNYINEEDVRNVSANFDVHDIPLDTVNAHFHLNCNDDRNKPIFSFFSTDVVGHRVHRP